MTLIFFLCWWRQCLKFCQDLHITPTLPVSSKHSSIWVCQKIKLAEKGLKTPCVGIFNSWLTHVEGNGAGHRIWPLPLLCNAITTHSRMQHNKNDSHFQFKLELKLIYASWASNSWSLTFTFFCILCFSWSGNVCKTLGGKKGERETLKSQAASRNNPDSRWYFKASGQEESSSPEALYHFRSPEIFLNSRSSLTSLKVIMNNQYYIWSLA